MNRLPSGDASGSIPTMLRRLLNLREPQELSEAALEQMQARLVQGELSEPQAILLLEQRIAQNDLDGIRSILDFMMSLGMRSPKVLRLASEFFLGTRNYDEAHRYAQDLYYEYEPSGPALRTLAMVNVLRGQYTAALSNFEDYTRRYRVDALTLHMYFEALLRVGAVEQGLNQLGQYGRLRPDVMNFWQNYRSGKRFSKFSWRGRPTKKPTVVDESRTQSLQAFLRTVVRTPLAAAVKDVAELDARLGQGHYLADGARFEHPEVWEAPAQFEHHMSGDCEDFALWAWVNLIRLGYPARFTIGGVYEDALNHAWVTVHRRGVIQVLECTPQYYNPLIIAHCAVEYRPMLSVDKNLHWYEH